MGASMTTRSTPAHAGNTVVMQESKVRVWVYPRPRGEYGYLYPPQFELLGLPPPTRGIRWAQSPYHGNDGSTPAHAGNTPCR